MSLDKAVLIGLAGNETSKELTGTSEVSVGRTAVATGAGALYGGIAAGTVVVAGAASAPVIVPLAALGAAASFVASLWD